ncbi:MAG: c-type cytochrome [Phycisphaerales bacterium]|nr:c-type cytochrome [Phycisphaerales bacterium]
MSGGKHDAIAADSGPVTDHEYDGIREYDNPTPGWWKWVFGASIVFSVLYAVFFHASVYGWTVQDVWARQQTAYYKQVFGAVGELKTDEGTILSQMSNPEFMDVARATFVANCAACHKRDGGGDVGVNLCDDSYKNVEKVEDLFKVITDGAANGAMPSWKTRLSSNERVILAAYVASLRGTTPAAGKVAEGKVIAPWPKAPAPGAK